MIEQICNTHPRLQKPVLTDQYVVLAAQDEIAHGKTCREALEYLLERTRLYREMTDQWPEDQKRFILSSFQFFRTGEYRTDPKHWRKNGGRSEHDQNQPPVPTYEPESERIKKRIEAERQMARTGNGGVNS